MKTRIIVIQMNNNVDWDFVSTQVHQSATNLAFPPGLIDPRDVIENQRAIHVTGTHQTFG